jgi:plastocyanin
MTLIVLSLVGVLVLVATIAPPNPGSKQRDRAQATPRASAAPLTDPEAFDVSATLSATRGKPATVEAELGDRVQITVEASRPDSVALGDLSMQEVEPGIPARFELLADTPGDYPLALVNEGRRIGTLEVR